MSGLLYVSQTSPDSLGRGQVPQGNGGELTAQAMTRLGQSIENAGDTFAKISQHQVNINRETDEAKRTTEFLVGIDGLNQKYQNDPDPSTAPQRYQDEANKLRETSLNGFDPQTRAQLDLKLQRHAISANANQRFDALKRQGDQYTGNLDAQYQIYTNRYASAKTDAERQAITGEMDATLQSGVARGMITAKGAEGYRQGLAKTGDEAIALRAIGANPAAAQSAFADPTKFTGLDPVRRQQLADHAKAAAEEQRSASIVQQARFNPANAAFSAGRLTDPKQAEIVFDAAIIPQESGGNPKAVSVQGAMGVSQIMPDTARGVAKSIGRNDLANMDNATLRATLTSDPKLARELGLTYFQNNLKIFNGNLAATIASYHAGPGGVVAEAHQQAKAAFGETYTPEQFLSFMPKDWQDGSGKTTVSYVRDIFKRMGAPTNAPAMSPMSSYRVSNAVGQVLDHEVARRDQVTRNLVSVAGREADELAPILKDGYAPDPQRVASVRGTLMLGTQRGDAGAAEKLRSFDEAVSMAPIINQMYRMKPEHIEGELAAARQQMATGIVAPEQRRRVELLGKVSTEIATARKDNPIALLERQGIAPATSVNVNADMNDPGQLNAFRREVMARGAASNKAAELYGTHQFFRPEERIAAKQRFDDMGENDRFRMLKEISDHAPNEMTYRAAATELTGGNGYAAIAGMFMRRNPDLAKAILTGSALLEQPGVKPKVDDLRKGIETAFGGDMFPGVVQKQLIEASLAAFVADRGKNGALYDPQDISALQSAVERVIGKVEKINGKRVPIPADLASWQVSDSLSRMTDKDLDTLGGAYGAGGEKLGARFVGRNAQLVPMGVGDGRYAVMLPGPGGAPRPVMTRDQKPLTIDMPSFVKGVRLGAATTPAQARNATMADYARRGNDGREVQP